MVERSLLLLLTVLLGVGSSAMAAAEPHPRAAELIELHRRVFGTGSEIAMTAERLSLNVYTRTLLPGEQVVMLLSIALDRNQGAGRLRLCLDGQLTLDNVYRDGTISSWSAAADTVTVEPGDQEAILAELENFFIDPIAFRALDAEVVGYDGFVDYGVLAGEQVTVRLSASSVMSIAGRIRQVSLVFAEDGRLLGQHIRTPAGPLVAVSDGLMRVPTGLILRGLSVYFLVDGEAREGAIVRLFRVRADPVFRASMFDLESRDLPAAAHELEALSNRLRELTERIRRSAAQSAEIEGSRGRADEGFSREGAHQGDAALPPALLAT